MIKREKTQTSNPSNKYQANTANQAKLDSQATMDKVAFYNQNNHETKRTLLHNRT